MRNWFKNWMTKKGYNTHLELRIDWSELDLYGHVNNVSFFKYIQAARVNFWEKTGIQTLYELNNIGSLLASCKCEFKKPLHYPGQVKIISKIEYIKNTSFSILHQILDENNQIAAEAIDVMVLYDYTHQIKAKFPEDLKFKIENNQLF